MFINWRPVAWFLIFVLWLQPFSFLFAYDTNSDLLSEMSLKEHYEAKVQALEQQRYDLEIERERLLQTRGGTARLSQIDTQIRSIEVSVRNNQQLLVSAESRIEASRLRSLPDPARIKANQLRISTMAANTGYVQLATDSALAVPASLRTPAPAVVTAPAPPVTPVPVAAPSVTPSATPAPSPSVAPSAAPAPSASPASPPGGTATAIERWKDGKYYEVNRYTEGPNKGRFAPGGRRQLSDAEVEKMGTDLKTSQVRSLETNLQSSRDQSRVLQSEIEKTRDPAQKADLKSKAERQKAIEKELETEVAKAKGSPVKDFIKSGVSYAAMSVAVTASFNLVQQAIQNNGDLSKLDYAAAFQFVTTEQFWATTSGSFLGGMVGTAMGAFLPGPLKVLASVAGGAVGAQLMGGTWRDADWALIAAQVIGSTIGFYIGVFIGSFMGPLAPLAIIVFSALGSWVAEKALAWIRSSFSPKITAYQMNELTDTEVADLALFAEQAEESDLASLNSMSEEELRNQMFLTYQEYEVYQQSEPADRTPAGITQWKQTIDQKFRRYVTIRKILERLKAEKASVNQAEMSAMR